MDAKGHKGIFCTSQRCVFTECTVRLKTFVICFVTPTRGDASKNKHSVATECMVLPNVNNLGRPNAPVHADEESILRD